MATRGTLSHPKMVPSLSPAFPQRASVQARVESRGTSGGITDSWTPVSGLTNIPCAVSEVLPDKEIRGQEMQYGISYAKILLQGYFVIDSTMRIVVQGADIYDIISVNHDSQSRLTQLNGRIVDEESSPGV